MENEYSCLNELKSVGSVGVEEVSDDKLFQLLSTDLSSPVLVHYLNVGGDICCSWLELFVHGPVAVDKPLGYFD